MLKKHVRVMLELVKERTNMVLAKMRRTNTSCGKHLSNKITVSLKLIFTTTRYSSSDLRQFYENLYANQETLESPNESFHPSIVLADEDTCEPHESTASVADEKSTYTVSLNEVESDDDAVKMFTHYYCCRHSAEDSEEHAHSKQTKVAPSEVDSTVR